MSRLRASQLELPLEIGQGHIHIAHGHARIGVAEQFHDRGKAHAGTEHFRSVGMAQLMRDDTGGQAGRVTGQMQVIAETREKRYSAIHARPGAVRCQAADPESGRSAVDERDHGRRHQPEPCVPF